MNRLNISSLFLVLAFLCNGLMGQSDGIKGFSLNYDETKLDRSQTSPIVSYSRTLKKATPAVVAVTTKQVVRRLYPGGTDPIEDFLRRYYGLPRINQPRVEEERVPAGIGSGVIVTPQGHTITNAHVITDPRTGKPVEEVTVKLSDKKEYEAKIIGFDRSTGVAVLKIDAANLSLTLLWPTVILWKSETSFLRWEIHWALV